MKAPLCLQCSANDLRAIATYRDFVEAASLATDERRSICAYMKPLTAAAFETFIACKKCGFIRIDPMPSPGMLLEFYQSYYASSAYSLKQDKKIRRTLKRLKKIRRFVSGGTFLDVGCNVGFAVEAARRAGFKASGIEIDAKAVTYAQEHFPENRFTATTIENYQPGTAYDLVHCTEVL